MRCLGFSAPGLGEFCMPEAAAFLGCRGVPGARRHLAHRQIPSRIYPWMIVSPHLARLGYISISSVLADNSLNCGTTEKDQGVKAPKLPLPRGELLECFLLMTGTSRHTRAAKTSFGRYQRSHRRSNGSSSCGSESWSQVAGGRSTSSTS